jgi:adhesin/invasin
MQKIPRAIGKASGVAVGETNSSGTLSVEGGGLSVFAGLVTSRRGKPFTVLAVDKNNFRSILGAAFHPNEQAHHFEPIRHVNQAVNGGAGYVVRVVPSDMEIPYIKVSTPGNSNQPVTTTNIDPSLSTFSILPGNIIADGVSSVLLTFKPKDQYGNAVKGLTHISFDTTGVALKIGKTSETNGEYTATATGIIPGKVLIRPMNANKAVGTLSAQINVEKVPNQVATMDPDACEFWLSNRRVYANGSATLTLYLQLRDAAGDALSIQQSRVAFVGLGGVDVSITSAIEDAAHPGMYTAKLSGKTVGSVTVIPTVDGSMIGNIKGETVSLEKAPVSDDNSTQISGSQSTLKASKSTITANDGQDAVTVTFTARNASGNLMPGLADSLSLAIYNLTGVSKTAFVEKSAGVYETVLKLARSSVGDRGEIHVLYNSYTVDALAVTLTVTRIKETLPVVDVSRSAFSASASQAFATGGKGTNSTVTLTLTLVDTLGAAMPNRAVSFDILGAANTGAIREEQPGVYAVDVFSYQISNVNVEPKLDGLQVGSFNADIAFVQAPVVTAVMDSTRSAKTLTIAPSTIPADKTTQAQITLQIVDQNGDSMGGLESSLGLTTNIPGVTLSEFLEGTRGFYTATAVSDTEGVYIVTPTYNGVALGATTRTLTVTKVTNTPDPTRSKIESTTAAINDDGSETATLSLTLKNSSGKAITGVQAHVGFTADDMQYVSITQATETTAGVYTATVTGKSVKGSVIIRPQYDGVNIGNRSITLELHDPSTVAPPISVDLSGSTFSVDKDQLRADKGEIATVTFVAKDASGKTITDALLPHLIFKAAQTSGYSISAINSDNNGIYTATVQATSQTASGAIVIDAMYDSKSVQSTDGALSVSVQMVGEVSEPQSLLALTQPNIDADGVAKSVISFTAKDALGMVIKGATVDFTYSGLNSAALVKGAKTTVNGVTSVALSSIVPGQITIGVRVDGMTLADLSQTLTINSVLDESASTLTANPTSVVGDGVAQTTFTLTLKDHSGQGIAGLASHISLSDANGELNGVTLTDGGNGVYIAKYARTVTQDTTLSVHAVVFGSDVSHASTSVTFTKPVQSATTPLVANSMFTSSLPAGAIAPIDGSTTVTLTATLKNGTTPISGRNVALVSTPQALSTTTISSMVESPAGSGIYIGTIKATASDAFAVGITVDGAAFSIPTVRVEFAALSPDATHSTLSTSSTGAKTVGDSVQLTAVLKDASSVAVTGGTRRLKLYDTSSHDVVGGVAFTEVAGTPGTYIGTYTVTASDSGRVLSWALEFDGAVLNVQPLTLTVN